MYRIKFHLFIFLFIILFPKVIETVFQNNFKAQPINIKLNRLLIIKKSENQDDLLRFHINLLYLLVRKDVN